MSKEANSYEQLLIIDGPNIVGTLGFIDRDKLHDDFVRLSYPVLLQSLFSRKNNVRLVYVGRNPKKNTNFKHRDALEKYGFEMIEPEKQLESGDKWDDNQIIEILEKCSDTISTIYLMSGDIHFYEPIKKLKLKGKKVVIIGIPETTNNRLMDEFEFIDIRKLHDHIFYLRKDLKKEKEKKHFACKIEITGKTQNMDEFNRLFQELSKIVLSRINLEFEIHCEIQPKDS